MHVTKLAELKGIEGLGGPYKSLMRDGWSDSIKPCVFVHMSWGNKGGSSHLLGIESEACNSGVVLALRQGSWNSFGDKAEGFF
jgi:hypothetical protein